MVVLFSDIPHNLNFEKKEEIKKTEKKIKKTDKIKRKKSFKIKNKKLTFSGILINWKIKKSIKILKIKKNIKMFFFT